MCKENLISNTNINMYAVYTQNTEETSAKQQERGSAHEPNHKPPFLKRESSATAETTLIGDECADWESLYCDDEEAAYASLCHDEKHHQDEEADGTFKNRNSSSSTMGEEDLLKTIEVMPGLELPLRGSKETMQAVDCGFLTCTPCFCCGESLHCIQDVEFVVCPDCSVVSPVGNYDSSDGGPSYVGLGMKDDDLAESREFLVQSSDRCM
jgi:hypothetical protein